MIARVCDRCGSGCGEHSYGEDLYGKDLCKECKQDDKPLISVGHYKGLCSFCRKGSVGYTDPVICLNARRDGGALMCRDCAGLVQLELLAALERLLG